MKKILCLLMALMMLFSFTGCFSSDEEDEKEAISEEDGEEKKEKKKETEKEKDKDKEKEKEATKVKALALYSESEYDYYYDDYLGAGLVLLENQMIHLSPEDAEKYPGLSEAIENMNKEDKKSIAEEFESLKEVAYEHYESSPDYFTQYELTNEIGVKRADSNVLSLLSMSYSYTGGAHGYGAYIGINLDTKTGEEILISDAVTDTERLYELVADNIDKDALYPDTDIIEVLKGYETINYTLENGAITVYFNPYEVGPYASGLIEVYLSEKENPGLINKKYLKTAECFAVSINNGDVFYYDVTGDGVADEITYYVSESWESEGYVRIGVGDNFYEEEFWFYANSAYFVHTKNGKNYILAEYGYENDYCELVCYELDKGITKIGTVEGGFAYISTGEDSYGKEMFTNPESFNVDKRYDALGTSSVYTEHFINNNGNIEAKDDFWYISWPQEATVLQDIEFEIYDEAKRKVKGKKTLSEGETVETYAWDENGNSYIKTEDGTILKVPVNENTWPRTINGIDMEEVFEGFMFAG